LWQRLSQSGLKTIEEYFSMAAAKRNTRELLVQLQVLPATSDQERPVEARSAAGLSRDQEMLLRPLGRK
jgi:hypothetical protein